MNNFVTLLPTELREGIPCSMELSIECLVSHCGFLGSCYGLTIPAVECWLVWRGADLPQRMLYFALESQYATVI